MRGEVTLSIGLATRVAQAGEDGGLLVELADAALYGTVELALTIGALVAAIAGLGAPSVAARGMREPVITSASTASSLAPGACVVCAAAGPTIRRPVAPASALARRR